MNRKYNSKSKRRNNNKRNKEDYLSILPLLLILLVPIIVKFKPVDLTGVRENFRNDYTIDMDVFAYYKMWWFVTLTFLGGCIYLYKKSTNNIKLKKEKIYLPMLTYIVLAVLSTIFSPYREVAIIGFMERYENVFVLISYMVVMFLAINLIYEKKHIKTMFYVLGFSALVVTVIGIAQYYGYDFFASDIGDRIVLGKKYLHQVDKGYSKSSSSYSTLGNPNYLGVFTSMLFPLFSILTLESKKTFDKIFFASVSILLILALFTSNSRAGLIAVSIYLLVVFFLYLKKILKNPVLIGVIFLLLAITIAFNKYSDNVLFNRFSSIKDSLIAKEELDFQDIILERNTANIIVGDKELKIVYNDGDIGFYDGEGENLKLHREDYNITIRDNEGYPEHFFDVGYFEDDLAIKSQIVSNYGIMDFILVVDENEEFKFLTTKLELIDLVEYPSVDFIKNLRAASGRGYIWSRTIPLLKENLIIGKGPDTYALSFPQDDYIGKLKGFGRMNILVDKPHNLYLQIAVNTGVLSMLAIISIFIMYLYDSIKTLFIRGKEIEDEYKIFGIAVFFAFISFLVTSLTNDSTVYVSPVFWLLLGIGVNANMRVKELAEVKK